MTGELDYYNKTDLSNYAGEWVVILGKEVIAHGTSLKEVYAEAGVKAKGQKPIFTKIPKEAETLIL